MVKSPSVMLGAGLGQHGAALKAERPSESLHQERQLHDSHEGIAGGSRAEWSPRRDGFIWWWKGNRREILSNMKATGHMWLLSTRNVASATEEMRFFILF